MQLGKFEKYLIEEFYDDYRSGGLSQRAFTRRVAFITGSMASASTAMLLVGCTPNEVPASTDPMPAAVSRKPAMLPSRRTCSAAKAGPPRCTGTRYPVRSPAPVPTGTWLISPPLSTTWPGRTLSMAGG